MKLEDRLPTALDNIANSAPVEDPGDFDPNLATAATPTNRSSKRLLASAAAIGALGVAGLVMAAGRETPAPVSESVPDPTPPTVTLPPVPAAEPGPDGALLLPDATGMNLAYIEEGALAGDSPILWYATPTARPEARPYLRVVAYDSLPDGGPVDGCVMDGATVSSVLADGTLTCLKDRDPSDPTGAIQVDVDQFTVIIDGTATNDQLLTAAQNLTPGALSNSFEIDTAGLPPGVELIGTALFVSDFATTEVSKADAVDLIQANFVDGESRTIVYVAAPNSPPSLDTYRLGFESVTDVSVRGGPGFIRTLADQPNYLGLVWHENGITYQVASQGLTQNQLLANAEQLQPASQPAWEAAIAAIPDVERMEAEQMQDEPAATTTSPIDE